MKPPFGRAAWVLLPLALVGTLAWFATQYLRFLEQPLPLSPGGDVFVVEPGDTARAVVQRLAARDVTRNDWRWRLLFRLQPPAIQAGEYLLTDPLTPPALMQHLASGDVIQHRFTLVEGWTWSDLRRALLAHDVLEADVGMLADESIMSALGRPGEHPEGWFLPETYAVVRGDTAQDLLERAHDALQAALAEAWRSRAADLPLSSDYELLTLASIVEKESARASERPEIAGVFIRRLQQNWRLETDPTVIYGLGETFDGDIRRRDLRTDTPYNTYTRRGLPPTPIAMPSRQSLQAVAAPASGTAMFFVADGQGGHVFSDTLEDHNRAVRALLERTRD